MNRVLIVSNKGPVWNATQTATLREQREGADTIDSVIIALGKCDKWRWVATLESGHRLLFSVNMMNKYCPMIGHRVYCDKAMSRTDNKYLGKHYRVGPRYWTIVFQEDFDIGLR